MGLLQQKITSKIITIINIFVVVVVIHPRQPKIKTFEQIQFAKMLFTSGAFFFLFFVLFFFLFFFLINRLLYLNHLAVVPGILD